MRHQACLPRSWWEFCVEYSVHVYNRTPIKRLKSKTPHEAINRDKPDISHLWILGCGAYVFLHEDVQQDVLSPHAELCNDLYWFYQWSERLEVHAEHQYYLSCHKGSVR